MVINLAKINKLSSSEIALLKQKMNELDLDEKTKNELAVALLSSTPLHVDYKLFTDILDQALLIENMNSLATAVGLISPEEKLYIYQIKLNLQTNAGI